ncbi:hypothetical protein [Kineothrix sedimenti]|uniref:Uncharacterized protein n=1 Tax=Kineothrix sedimenti TaxID=3123317 RepID=A0ABZ3EVX7_9FIRM
MKQNSIIDSLTIKGLSYYIFFILMLTAKGLGLDSGDKLYYVLSLAALACIACKLCMTEYRFIEAVAIGMLVLIAFFAYINSGRLGIVLSVLAIVGMKDMDIGKLFRLGLVTFGASFIVTVLGAISGFIPNPLVVHEKGAIGEVIRWGMGYSTGNIFHVSYFILVVLLVYHMDARYGLKNLFWLMMGNILVFVFSLSYTGVAVTSFYLLLNLYAIKRKRLSLSERVLCQLPLPLCFLFSFIVPFLVKYPLGQKLDSLLQARLSFSSYYLTNQPITLLGTRMKEVPYSWVIMDNGYVYILMTFGVIVLLLFILAYMSAVITYTRRGEHGKLAIIFCFLLYGIMEQFISNAFMNLSLLFIGEMLFNAQNPRKIMRLQKIGIFSGLIKIGEKKVLFLKKKSVRREKVVEKIVHRRKWIWLSAGMAGVLSIFVYISFEPKADYITVPLTALNYIDAQGALFHTEDVYEQKSDLNNLMEHYRQITTDENFCNKVLSELKKNDGNNVDEAADLTAGKLKSMVEFSLPQYVHSSGIYNVFRMRILETDCDISEETYVSILKEITGELQSENEKAGISTELLIPERIWKSEGTDRIEHIVYKDSYFVKKDGNIVRTEQIRTAIIWMLMGAMTGSIISGACVAGVNRKT